MIEYSAFVMDASTVRVPKAAQSRKKCWWHKRFVGRRLLSGTPAVLGVIVGLMKPRFYRLILIVLAAILFTVSVLDNSRNVRRSGPIVAQGVNFPDRFCGQPPTRRRFIATPYVGKEPPLRSGKGTALWPTACHKRLPM